LPCPPPALPHPKQHHAHSHAHTHHHGATHAATRARSYSHIKSELAAYDARAALFPPASALDPSDPNFPSALQHWSSSALSQLGQLPRLTPSQLSAIAGAAAGIGDVSLFNAAAAAGGIGVGVGVGVGSASGTTGSGGAGGTLGTGTLPIDLPASLAALFEAKLTLDREKAKLMRMQKELKGYREGVAAAVESVSGSLTAAAAAATAKGKEVAAAVEDDLGECTCGRNG